jgi:hypothetical protein
MNQSLDELKKVGEVRLAGKRSRGTERLAEMQSQRSSASRSPALAMQRHTDKVADVSAECKLQRLMQKPTAEVHC